MIEKGDVVKLKRIPCLPMLVTRVDKDPLSMQSATIWTTWMTPDGQIGAMKEVSAAHFDVITSASDVDQLFREFTCPATP